MLHLGPGTLQHGRGFVQLGVLDVDRRNGLRSNRLSSRPLLIELSDCPVCRMQLLFSLPKGGADGFVPYLGPPFIIPSTCIRGRRP